jgi:DNA-directed RNA polymerase subunit RPC12/RpoP
MEYLCSECSTQLSEFEIELNELYPVGRLYCEFCQNKHERKIIKKIAEDFANELDFYDFPHLKIKMTIQEYQLFEKDKKKIAIGQLKIKKEYEK